MIWCIINCIILLYHIVLYCIVLYCIVFYSILFYCIVLYYMFYTIFLLYVQSKAPEKGSSGQRLASYFPFGITRPIFELGEPPVLGNVTRGIPQSGRNTSWRGGVQGEGGDMVLLSLKGDLRFRYSATTLDVTTKTWECRMSLSLLHSVETCWNIHRYAIYVSFILFSFVYVCLTLFLCVFMLFLKLLFVDYTWFLVNCPASQAVIFPLGRWLLGISRRERWWWRRGARNEDDYTPED